MKMDEKFFKTFRLLTISLFLIFIFNVFILLRTHYSTNSIYQSIASLVFFIIALIIYTYYKRVGLSEYPPRISNTKIRLSYIISLILFILALISLMFANWEALIFFLTVAACFAMAPLIVDYRFSTRAH